MAFGGWPKAAIDFFDGLEEDNSKSYWEANKKVYNECVLAPMRELLTELEPEFGAGRVFRPYRDVRFSKDKSPYKTNIAATVGGAGYVSLSAAGLGVGSGYYDMASDQLERYRQALIDDKRGAELDKIVEQLRGKGHNLMAHNTLKTAPKGYPKDHARIELLRLKGLAMFHEWPVAPWLSTKKAKDRVVSVIRDAGPMNGWLDKHVGPSTVVEPYH